MSAFLSFFWTTGLLYIIAGFILGEFAGYFYHRYFLHALILMRDKLVDGVHKKITYLFVPWTLAYDKHMWHHYFIYPEPDAPGSSPKTFRPSYTYYAALEKSDHIFGRERSESATFDYVEYLLRKVGVVFALDWIIISNLFALAMYFVIGDLTAFAYFYAGGLIAGFFNQYIHDSFHVKPHAKLAEVPWKHWFLPAVFFANMGEHLPLMNKYYRYLYVRHIAHHYQNIRTDDANYKYHGVKLNAGYVNFTIFNPIPDYLFGSSSNKVYQETK